LARQARVPDRILRYGDARLRLRCRDIDVGEDARGLADALWAALDAAGGIGLAAPQVGDLRRVIAARDPAAPRTRSLILVNPVIVATEGPQIWFEEGCLSFPGLYLRVRRPQRVIVAYRDLDGAPRRLEDDALLARIVQHEIDHLDGVLYIDRLPAWRRWLLAGRLAYLRRGPRKDVA
jgi:peptide deformylase